MTRRLTAEDGILSGMSSGGAMTTALHQEASKIEEGIIVSTVCNRGDRYLSGDLFM